MYPYKAYQALLNKLKNSPRHGMPLKQERSNNSLRCSAPSVQMAPTSDEMFTAYKEILRTKDREAALAMWTSLVNNVINLTQPRSTTGNTLLIDLLAYGYEADALITAVDQLIQKDTQQVNTAGKNGKTPLMIAAENGSENQVNLLLRYGADKSAQNNAGQTAADIVEGILKKAEDPMEDAYEEVGPVYERVRRALSTS